MLKSQGSSGISMILKIFVDGGARGNPGPGAIGVVIKNQDNELLARFGKLIGITTNNMAEYTAVCEALVWVIKAKKENKIENVDGVNFFSDSQLLVSQLNGLFKVKNSKLRELILKIRQLEQEVGGGVFYQAIPREENELADFLVNQALDNIR